MKYCGLGRALLRSMAGPARAEPGLPMPPIVLSPPGAGGERITDDGLVANWYPGEGLAHRATLLLLGGSEGGLGPGAARLAADLVAHGFAVLQLAYFGAPGLPPALVMIPLEYFDKALLWLSRQLTVDPVRIGLIGASKGAEASLLIAARNPGIRAVAVGAPSAAVWPGMDFSGSGVIQSSWSVNAKPLPYLSYGGSATTMLGAYQSGLDTLPAHPEAAIPVERIRVSVLLVCGRDDTLWPSCTMSGIVARKMGQRATLLAYDDAGHAVFGPPVAPDSPDYSFLGTLGGSPAGNDAARGDAWPKVRNFLIRELAVR
jgi:dienelactone hydrolase